MGKGRGYCFARFFFQQEFLGVEKAVANVQILAKLVIEVCDEIFCFFLYELFCSLQKGFDVTQQAEIDNFLIQQDGTESKSRYYLIDLMI